MSHKAQASICIALLIVGLFLRSDGVLEKILYYKDYYFSDHSVTLENVTIQASREWVLEKRPTIAELKNLQIRKAGVNITNDEYMALLIDKTGKLINHRLLLLDSFDINGEKYSSYEIVPLPKSNPDRYIIAALTTPIVLMVANIEKGKSFLRTTTVIVNE